MNSRFKGQTQVLTAVLLGGMLIAGVSAAYLWGIPKIKKSQNVNNAEKSLSDIKEVSRAIDSVATGSGSRTVPIDLGDGSLDIDTEKDMITYKTLTRGLFVARDWAPLNENDMQGVNSSTGLPSDGYGIRGEDKPVLVIGLSSGSTGGESDLVTTTYRMVMRDIFDTGSSRTYHIDLVQNGNLDASGDSHTIHLKSAGEETDIGKGVEGGILNRRKVMIRVS
ncbi:MAG: hypothetical protein MUP63_04125 [Candidatus Nanohaloarchaeota archaeon QJJ-7]|nr:hypothetical protein [Candidatus Nanohaloarchaeota archaeon QJJ-7]